MTSEVSRRARAMVAERLPEARGLGHALAELIDEPDEFVAVARAGFERLSDEEYAAEQERVAPGSGLVFGVRWPLIQAVAAQLRRPLEEGTSSSALWLAQRLATEPERELRLFGLEPLKRALPDDPERSWQLMRRLARGAGDWVAVDTLAELYSLGILFEPVRWAEIEQLAYSDSRWERRLVASSIARMPFHLPRQRRSELLRLDALTLIKTLLGDNDEQVQKALAWALREWVQVDPAGVRDLLRAETATARATEDGHRAWVLREALPALPSLAPELREQLAHIRRHAGSPSTSAAAQTAAAFMGAGPLHRASDVAVSMQGDRQRAAERAR